MFDINTDKFNIAGDLMQSLSSISEVLKSSVAVEISNDIMSIFVNPFMSLTAVFTQFGLDMFSFLVTPITSNNDLIKTGLENTLKAIQPLSDTLSNIFTTFGDIVTNVYDNHLKPFFDSVTSGVSDTFGKFLNVYNEFIAPFFEHLTENVKDVWDNHLKKLWTNIGDFIGSIIDFIKVLWENWIKPLVDWIVENIVPKIIPVLQTIYDNFSKVFSVITDVINGVITSLKGVMEFITGIKDVFKGIVDSFVSIFKVPINAIIKGINKFIDGVNKIHLPDWDILGSYAGKGFNIKKIPELAQGGWVAPNSPQLAIVGDNTREGEIVTPESKMYEQCVKAINDSKVNSDQSTEMHIYVHYEDGRTIINRINKTQREEGRILLEV